MTAQLGLVRAQRRRVGGALTVDGRGLLLIDRVELILGLFARGGIESEIRKAHLDREPLRGILLRQPQGKIGLVLLQLLGLGAIFLRRLVLKLSLNRRAGGAVLRDDALLIRHQVCVRRGGGLLHLLLRGAAHLLRGAGTRAVNARCGQRRVYRLVLTILEIALLLRQNRIRAGLRLAQLAIELGGLRRDLRGAQGNARRGRLQIDCSDRIVELRELRIERMMFDDFVYAYVAGAADRRGVDVRRATRGRKERGKDEQLTS